MREDCWWGCYAASLKGIITAASFAHPAKYSWALIQRIYRHALDEQWVHPGDLVVDPMAGVGIGGLAAAACGLQFIGIELEHHFWRLGEGYDCPGLTKEDWVRWFNRYPRNADLCQTCQKEAPSWYTGNGVIPERAAHRFLGNFDLHRRTWEALGKPIPRIIQGDARQLITLCQQAGMVVSSPPYADTAVAHVDGNVSGKPGGTLRNRDHPVSDARHSVGYSPLSAVVSSPPYANSVNAEACGIDWTKMGPATGNRKRGPGSQHYETQMAQMNYHPKAVVSSPPFLDARQDTTPSRKGKTAPTRHDPEAWSPPSMILSSPPYAKSIHDGNGIDSSKLTGNPAGKNSQAFAEGYGSQAAQIGALREGSLTAVITSPPYESQASNCATNHGKEGKSTWKAGGIAAREGFQGYGETDGQVGNTSHETYWDAMAVIYRQVYEILPLGGHCILVLKSFVRQGKIVNLPDMTRQLLEHLGFRVVHMHKAMLTSEIAQLTLDGGEDRKSRASFFRWLHAKKYPHLFIDHETVLCCLKDK
jgi:hypothetical protein